MSFKVILERNGRFKKPGERITLAHFTTRRYARQALESWSRWLEATRGQLTVKIEEQAEKRWR
jgi:hypothetical protein